MQRVALITGGMGGLGEAVCIKLAALGDKVITTYSPGNTTAHEWLRKMNDMGYGFKAYECDVADFDSCRNCVEQVVAENGPIDVLINNAGIMLSLPYDHYPPEQIAHILKINIEAPVAFINGVAKGMMARGAGRIVNNTSIAGHIGHPDIWYGITKAGLLNATKSYAKLLGPHGIQINAVAASPVDTDMLSTIPEARKAEFKKSVVSGRFAQAGEIANTIGWLATEAPDYINGSCIDINGGSYLR